MISKNTKEILFFPAIFFLVISLISHYDTGKRYRETCEKIYSIVNYDMTKFEKLLGNDISTNCKNSWTKPE